MGFLVQKEDILTSLHVFPLCDCVNYVRRNDPVNSAPQNPVYLCTAWELFRQARHRSQERVLYRDPRNIPEMGILSNDRADAVLFHGS